MKLVSRALFTGTQEELEARVTAFKEAVEAHKFTVGIPAPREEELIEQLVKLDVPFAVEPPIAVVLPDEIEPELARHEVYVVPTNSDVF